MALGALHAIVFIIIFACQIFFYTNNLRFNHFVTAQKLKTIHCGKSDAHINHELFVPYNVLVILQTIVHFDFQETMIDKVVQSVWINAFADLFFSLFLFIYAPIYIYNYVKNFIKYKNLLSICQNFFLIFNYVKFNNF